MKDINLISLFDIIKKWKILLFISVISLSIISVTLSLIVPLTYTSNASIIPPGGNSLIDSFLPSAMTKGLGGLISGSSSDPNNGVNKTISILKSRELVENTIKEFDLFSYYGASNIEDAIIGFNSDFTILLTQEGMVSVSFRQKTKFFHPEDNELEVRGRVKDITQFIIDELDRKYTFLETQKARYQRIVIERRYRENLNEISRLEDAIVEFSNQYGVFDFELQLQSQLEAIYQFETELLNTELQYEVLLNSYDESHQLILNQKKKIDAIKGKIDDLKKGEIYSELQSSLDLAPEIGRKYFELQREMAVQAAIFEFVNQQYEQIKVQEARDTPSLQFIDTPQEPTKRTSPRRSIMVITLCGVGFFVVISLITIIEFITWKSNTTKMADNQ